MFLIKEGREIFKVGVDTMEDAINVATSPDNYEHF